jgi:endonuclease YncB( thermonuclease family)
MIGLALFFCPLVASSADIYTWTDEDGHRYFSDQPPPGPSNVRPFAGKAVEEPPSTPSVKPQIFSARVVVVSQGDTLTVLRDGRLIDIRLHAVDSPEPGQFLSEAARRFTYELCFDRMVSVHPVAKAPPGELLAIVYLEDRRELNYELLKAGLAWHSKKFSSDRMYDAAMTYARKQRVGIWQDADPVPPWHFRKGGPAAFLLPREGAVD